MQGKYSTCCSIALALEIEGLFKKIESNVVLKIFYKCSVLKLLIPQNIGFNVTISSRTVVMLIFNILNFHFLVKLSVFYIPLNLSLPPFYFCPCPTVLRAYMGLCAQGSTGGIQGTIMYQGLNLGCLHARQMSNLVCYLSLWLSACLFIYF